MAEQDAEFIGIVKGVNLKPYVEKTPLGERTRSCCSHSIRVTGDDQEMEQQYQLLKRMYGQRVRVTITLEQGEL